MSSPVAIGSLEKESSLNPRVLPERGISVYYGCPEMPRLSHYFLPRLLLSEKRILYLDGANQINPLLIARFARLAHSTVRKYKLLKRQMEEFAKGRGLRFLVEFDLPSVSQFRASGRMAHGRAPRSWNASGLSSDLLRNGSGLQRIRLPI
jgi:hypothetical protein